MRITCLILGRHAWEYVFDPNFDDVEYISEDDFIIKSFLYSRRCKFCEKTEKMDRKAWWATAGVVPSEKT